MVWTEHPYLGGLDAQWLQWLQWAKPEDLRKSEQLMEVFSAWLRDPRNPARDQTLCELETRLPMLRILDDAVHSLRMDTLDGPQVSETAEGPVFELGMHAKGRTILDALWKHHDVARVNGMLGLDNRFTAEVPDNVFALSAAERFGVRDDAVLVETLQEVTNGAHLNFYTWMEFAEREAKRLHQEASAADEQLEQQALSDEAKVREFFDDCIRHIAPRLGATKAGAADAHGSTGEGGGRGSGQASEETFVKFAFDIDGELVTETKPRDAGMSALYSLGLPEVPASTFYSARRKPGVSFDIPGLPGFQVVFDAISKFGSGKQLMWTIYGNLTSIGAGFKEALASLPVDTPHHYTQYRDKVVIASHTDDPVSRIQFAVVRFAAVKESGGTGTGWLAKRVNKDPSRESDRSGCLSPHLREIRTVRRSGRRSWTRTGRSRCVGGSDATGHLPSADRR
ncbi:hypothetical protein AB0M48_39075 [Lentzea sp. NPDC051208]|uniref:hypothetical protein n=1 Tax=Lentzea sp. NPDC051208 TaxID=3154642 RepID=UPI0034356683